MDFSASWFSQFCSRNNLNLVNAQTLLQQRNLYYHQNVTSQFHQMLHNVIHHVPQLLWNMDETASTYHRSGKVVVSNNRFPLSEASINIGHFTMICCINAAGFTFFPFYFIINI